MPVAARQVGIGGARLGEREIGGQRDEGLQPRLDIANAGQHFGRHLDRRDVTAFDPSGEGGDVAEEIDLGHAVACRLFGLSNYWKFMVKATYFARKVRFLLNAGAMLIPRRPS